MIRSFIDFIFTEHPELTFTMLIIRTVVIILPVYLMAKYLV